MLSAPSGNRVSSASRPMPMTKIATRTSTSVVAGRRIITVSPLAPGLQSRGPAVRSKGEGVGIVIVRVHRVDADQPGARVDRHQQLVARLAPGDEGWIERHVAQPEGDAVVRGATANHAAEGR